MTLPRFLLSLLIVAVFCSALALVLVRHHNRLLFLDLQSLRQQRDQLTIEWGRLQLEHSTLAHPARIEQLARERLDMLRPEHSIMINLGHGQIAP